MPLMASHDPAAGDALDYNRSDADGKHRSHRFLGANQAMPALLKLPGAEEQVEAHRAVAPGGGRDPRDRRASGRRAPRWRSSSSRRPRSRAGEPITIRASITSNKVGHDFPTGPLDIIQAWVELRSRTPGGRVVHASGRRDERHFIEPGTFMFKAEPVDQYGNLIDRHNLWEMVGRALPALALPRLLRHRRVLVPVPGRRGQGRRPRCGARTSASTRRRAPRPSSRSRRACSTARSTSTCSTSCSGRRRASPCRSRRWRGPRRASASSRRRAAGRPPGPAALQLATLRP